MSKANGTGQRVSDHQLALLPPDLLGERVRPVPRWRVAVEVCRDAMTFLTLTVLCLWVVPAVSEAKRVVAEERQAAVEVQTRERELEGSRRQVVALQAATIAQGEQLRKLNEENARLAAEVNRALRGDR